MIDFLKNFLSGEKLSEEKNLLSSMKKRDVLSVGGDDEPSAPQGGCDTPEEYSGCGGCGCRR
jgi:hypothetical protein